MKVPDVQLLQWQQDPSVHCTKIIIKDCEMLYVRLVKCNKGHLMPPKKICMLTLYSGWSWPWDTVFNVLRLLLLEPSVPKMINSSSTLTGIFIYP